MERIGREKKWLQNENYQIAAFALLCTILSFGIFMGQFLYSDVVTFAKGGDQSKLCFAAFMKLRECFLNGESLVGVDSGSFNGATEFFIRANLPVAYPIFVLFAVLATMLPARGMYLLMYAVHMFVSVWILQLVCRRYFQLSRAVSMAVGALLVYQLCIQMWYVSFYFATALSVVCFFCFLEVHDRPSVKTYILATLSTILALTSGYVTLSVALLLVAYIYAWFYLTSRDGVLTFKKWLCFSAPTIVGGIICVPYLLQILIYVKMIVHSSTALADVISVQFRLTDLAGVVSSFSFTATSATEVVAAYSLGLITCFVFFLAVRDRALSQLPRQEKCIVIASTAVFVLIVLWSTESATALTGWMYSLIPILGGMHIPNRYFTVTMPYLYLAIGILAKQISWERRKRECRVAGLTAFGVTVLYVAALRMGATLPAVFETAFIIELLSLALFCYVLYYYSGKTGRSSGLVVAIFIWILITLLSGATYMNNVNATYDRQSTVESKSIIFSEDRQNAIDHFISETGSDKQIYRFVAYDSLESVPEYLQPNYEWYNFSDYDLCNYTGYDLHLCVPREYMQNVSGWFNTYNWEYIVNTRADYFMTDYATIDANRTLFDSVIDWDKGVVDIGSGRIMVALRHFVPSVICGTPFVYEDRNSLDNGYFYSHDLSNDNIVSFLTDQNANYELTISSDHPSVLVFLPYANRNYHYYLDGIELTPEIVNMQSVFRVGDGKHTLRVKYKNTMGAVGYYAVIGCATCLAVFTVGAAVISTRKKKKQVGSKIT